MLKVLLDRKVYYPLFVAAIPLMAVSCDLFTALLAAVISILTVTLSAIAISALKNLLNSKTAPIAQLVIAVGIVGILTVPAALILPEAVESLGIYLPIIAVLSPVITGYDGCLKNSIGVAAIDALIPAVGHGILLILCGLLREVFGMGSIFGIDLYTKWLTPVAFLAKPAGGLLLLGVLLICYNYILKKTVKEGK